MLSASEERFWGRTDSETLQNLIDPKEMAVQMSLFDYEQHEEESATKLLINELNRSLKKPLLKRASELEKKDGNN